MIKFIFYNEWTASSMKSKLEGALEKHAFQDGTDGFKSSNDFVFIGHFNVNNPWENNCKCINTKRVRKTFKNGIGFHSHNQCISCGKISQVLKREPNDAKLPDFDQTIEDLERQRIDEIVEKRRQWDVDTGAELSDFIAKEKQIKYEAWKAMYYKYLESQEWSKLRAKVLKRDNHTCQVCLENKAIQVHHESYAFHNLDVENCLCLVSVCKNCHAKLHKAYEDMQFSLNCVR